MTTEAQREIQRKAVIAMRVARAPEPNDEGAKATTCHDCGATFWQWEREYKDCCPDCGGDRMLSAQEQMQHRRGPYYMRAVIKQLAYWTREAQRLGLSV